MPVKSGSERYPPHGKLRVYRGRTGGEWQALTMGLPRNDCYVNALRGASTTGALTQPVGRREGSRSPCLWLMEWGGSRCPA